MAKDDRTTTGGHDPWDQRTHIERINQFDNPADGSVIDVWHGEGEPSPMPKPPKPQPRSKKKKA